MPRIDKDQIVGPDGQILSEQTVSRPIPKISTDQWRQIKKDLRDFRQLPTPLTAGQQRQWLIAVSQAIQFLGNELDDENE
jgi:hypothetical protein